MPLYELPDGRKLDAPDGMSLGGAVDMAVQQGHFTPQEAQQMLEGQVSLPEIMNSREAFGLNVSNQVAERSPFGLIDQVDPRVMQQGAEFRVATDIADYVRQTLEEVPQAGFELLGQSDKPWQDWLSTRYEQKALREGRPPHYVTFRRTAI